MGDVALSIGTRPLTASDVPVCAGWVDEHGLFRPYGLTSAKLGGLLEEALDRGDGLLVAEDEAGTGTSNLLGLAWFLTRGTFYHSAYLRLLLVSEQATGGGVGRHLMAAVESIAFEQASDLFLLVNTDNHAAQRFYERLGYRRVGELNDYVAPGLHEYVYRKQCPKPA